MPLLFDPPLVSFFYVGVVHRLRDELDNTAGLLDLALSLLGDVTGTDDDRDVGNATLAEDLGVAEREEVEDGGLLGALGGDVLIALLSGDERPELVEVDDRLPELLLSLVDCPACKHMTYLQAELSVKTYSNACRPFRSNQGGTCPCWCGGGASRCQSRHFTRL